MTGFPTPHRKEEWRTVPAAPMYEVSDLGRVRSWVQKGGPLALRGTRRQSPVLLKQYPRGKERLTNVPYLSVELHRKPWMVHRLVLLAFRGPCPDNFQGAHLNGNRSDNKLSNLAWVSPVENNRHKVLHGTDHATIAKTRPECFARGERTNHAKLRATDIPEIRLLAGKMRVVEIALKYGVSRSNIYFMLAGKSWRHV